MTDAEQEELFAAAVREHVRGMSDSDFRAFVAETRSPNEPRPGDAGRAAAAIRHGQQTSGGAAGRAAAERRDQNTTIGD